MSLPLRSSFRPFRRAGFTLVELMMVVLIISVLASIAIPSFIRVQRRTKSSTIANDFRTFAAAFDTYAQELGTWPANGTAGTLPAAMNNRINKTQFQRKSPMGGQYKWNYNQVELGTTLTACLTINATASAPLPLDVNQLTDLEHLIDGAHQLNWLGGSFRIGTGTVPCYLIQP
jgi:prepilin-type N-terminal cleavage/methylation domain-containing protein